MYAEPVERASRVAAPGRTRRWLRGTARFARREPLGAIGAFILVAMALMAVAAPLISPYDPAFADTTALSAPPSADHLLGTDAFGRDLLSRLIYGARVSLLVGLGSSLAGVVAGAFLGMVSAFYGGLVDGVIQRVMDALLAFPMLLLALALTTALGASVQNVIIALAIPITPRAARVIRSSVLSVKESTYVEAARAMGVSDWRLMFRHILPNALAPLFIIATAYIGLAITQEAALDFLGAGIKEPTPSWGLMLSGSAVSLALRAPWIAIFPGVAILLAVLSSNLLGDALRDTLDPRLRRL